MIAAERGTEKIAVAAESFSGYSRTIARFWWGKNSNKGA
ncbi:MAG: hypothetical protein H6577_02610 [Lewinellaceae bacterium]|nr:hypothetical protein [Lewinellaceae bacterium]